MIRDWQRGTPDIRFGIPDKLKARGIRGSWTLRDDPEREALGAAHQETQQFLLRPEVGLEKNALSYSSWKIGFGEVIPKRCRRFES